jgi:hypothetical protein
MRKSVGQAPTAGEQTQQKPCRTSSDIGAELENHTFGRGPMWDRKGLIISKEILINLGSNMISIRCYTNGDLRVCRLKNSDRNNFILITIRNDAFQ